MNERIRELMLHAGTDTSGKWMGVEHAEKFAELIIKECGHAVDNAPQPVVRFLPYLLKHFGVEE
jgi:hypothetical protein